MGIVSIYIFSRSRFCQDFVNCTHFVSDRILVVTVSILQWILCYLYIFIDKSHFIQIS